MKVAKAFSELGLATIVVGLVIATLAGAEPLPSGAGSSPEVPVVTAAPVSIEPSPAEGSARFATPELSRAAVSQDSKSSGPSADAPSAVAPAAAVIVPVAAATAPPTPSDVPAPAASTAVDPNVPAVAPATTAAAAPAATTQTAATQAAVVKPAEETTVGGTPGLKPARELFGAVKSPAPLSARAIGTYARGCLSGGQALPVDGPAWQAMRLSRNRNWGHPKLVALVQKLAADGKANDGWPGLLVGDLAQPRGGPMLTGHASHQIGLDADIWLTPMPDRTLTNDERETIEATSMLSEDGLAVARDNWTDAHLKIIKRAASYPEVERILVHPAIKQVLCAAAGTDRTWLNKVRPYWGHHYHMHIRIGCPSGSGECASQKPVPGDDGCGKELEDWLKLLAKIKPEPAPLPIPAPVPTVKAKEKPQITLDKLPSECRVVLSTGNPDVAKDIAAAAKAASKAEVAASKAAVKADAKISAVDGKTSDKKPAAVAVKVPADHAAKTPSPKEPAAKSAEKATVH